MPVDHELHKRRLGRNIFVGLVLFGLVALIFFVSIAKFQDTI